MPTDTENVCLSGKTGSDRRTVKSTRLPESDIAVRKSVRQRREAEGALEAFGEVCHRMRRPKTSRTAPYNRLSLNAEGGGANGHAGFAQPLRAARRCLQHCDRRRRPHRPRNGRPAAQRQSLVDDAHHKVPPAGFKYLVTEMLCWAAGGPQKYTGKDMETSHRHLRITPGEWDAFMDDVARTLDKFAVPAAERAEVVAIVESTRRSIVVA